MSTKIKSFRNRTNHESAPPPYSQTPPPATGDNPYHAGYDQPGDGQYKYGPYLQQQQQQGPGQFTFGQGTYPLTPQPATTTTQVNVIPAPVIVGVANRDYTRSAIWVCLCCFFPTGIVAIYYANKAQDEYARGDVAAANSSNSMARMFINISVVIGIIGVIVAIIVPIVVFVVAASAAVSTLGNDFADALNNMTDANSFHSDY